MNTLVINDLNQINNSASEFLAQTHPSKHFAFYGNMGAGKTTFIKALCQKLAVIDPVSSPSFAIVNEYKTADDLNVFHFDFYRIKSINEVYNLGYEDYFFGNDYCFLEWPELVEDLIPEHFVKVKITVTDDGKRVLSYL
jgi:tRNA threonylcarbamoyladenosine biosynthesis protein TsaE